MIINNGNIVFNKGITRVGKYEPLPDDLNYYWKLNGNFYDEVSQTINGSIDSWNLFAFDTPSHNGTQFLYKYDEDCLNRFASGCALPYPGFTYGVPKTVNIWCKFPYLMPDYFCADAYIFASAGFIIHIDDGFITMTVGPSLPAPYLQYEVPFTTGDDVWKMLTFTFDGTYTSAGSNTYVNGISQTKANITESPDNTTTITQTTTYLGGNEGGASSQSFTRGAFDELGVWNRVLSQASITELYNNGNGLTYPFN
jgi:hypothetical protein